MLEKLITNLKNSLPGPIRKKLGMEGNDEQDEAEESDSDGEQQHDNDENQPDDAAEKRKKQISMAMRVGLILIVAYLAFDEFVLKKNKSEPSVDEMLASMPVKRKKTKKEAAVDPNTKPAEVAAPAVEMAPADSTTEASTPTDTSSMDVPPIENVNILDKNDPVTAAPESQLQIETPATEVPEVVTETKVVDTSVEKKIDQLVDNIDQSSPTTEEVKIPSQLQTQKSPLDELDKAPAKETSMASKIVEVATETPAPAYDQVGRGLVYNCKDKYWACVDKPAYLLCNRNMKWNDSKGNAKECVVQNIYNTDEDCAKVQKYNVTMSIATSFCQ